MVKKLILLLSLFLSCGFSQDEYLNIDADFFEADEKKQQMYFKGNVKMTKGKDTLTSKYLLIKTEPSKNDKSKQVPKDYMASGDVKFQLNLKDNVLKGEGDKVHYYPNEQRYVIVGNGYLEDVKEGKKVNADKIYIDEKTGYSRIDSSSDQPVKFRLKLDTNKEENSSE